MEWLYSFLVVSCLVVSGVWLLGYDIYYMLMTRFIQKHESPEFKHSIETIFNYTGEANTRIDYLLRGLARVPVFPTEHYGVVIKVRRLYIHSLGRQVDFAGSDSPFLFAVPKSDKRLVDFAEGSTLFKRFPDVPDLPEIDWQIYWITRPWRFYFTMIKPLRRKRRSVDP